MKAKIKKKSLLLGIASCVMVLPLAFGGSSASAWGPERTTYTMASPAKRAVFNSIIDNAAVGDERDFVRVAEVDSGEAFTSELELQPGKDYIVMIYFHNDASATYNDAAHNRVGFAENVRVVSYFPESLAKRERGKIDGAIVASNTDPQVVWDEAYITASEAMTLKYIEGTARIRNQKAANGSELSDKLFTADGVFIGTNSLNGLIPGCDEYAGEVFYRFHTEAIEQPEEPEPTPEEPEPEPTPDEQTPEPEVKIPETPQELPETGPAEVALAIVVVIAIIAGFVYWRKTSHAVRKATRSAKGRGGKRK